MSRSLAALWAIATLIGSLWLGAVVMLRGVPDPATGIELLDLVLRLVHTAAERAGTTLAGLGVIVFGGILALACLIPGQGASGHDGGWFGDSDCGGDGGD